MILTQEEFDSYVKNIDIKYVGNKSNITEYLATIAKYFNLRVQNDTRSSN